MSKVAELEHKHRGGVGNSFYGEMMQLAKSLEDENTSLKSQLAERDKTILEQQEQITKLTESAKIKSGMILHTPGSLAYLLNAECIKALQEAEAAIISSRKTGYGPFAEIIKEMAAELKEGK